MGNGSNADCSHQRQILAVEAGSRPEGTEVVLEALVRPEEVVMVRIDGRGRLDVPRSVVTLSIKYCQFQGVVTLATRGIGSFQHYQRELAIGQQT
jgi:hypothetical protein